MKKRVIPIIIVVVLLALAALWYFVWRDKGTVTVAEPPVE